MKLQLTNRRKSARSYVGSTFAVMTMLASVGIAAPFATAGASTTGPTVTASGTLDIGATVRVIPNASFGTVTGGLIDLHFSLTQPVNICRIMPVTLGGCVGPTSTQPALPYQNTGQTYPNWQGDLTITGYVAAGLTYEGANSSTCTESSGSLTCHFDFLNNYFKTFDVFFTPTTSYVDGSGVSANMVVSAIAPPSTIITSSPSPTNMDQCKQGGWTSFFNTITTTETLGFSPVTYDNLSGYLPVWTPTTTTNSSPTFTNQGSCVSSVVANSNSNK